MLNPQSAQQVRQALSNWRSQGSHITVRNAVIHLQLAPPHRVDQVLNASATFRDNLMDNFPKPGPKADTRPGSGSGSNGFQRPVTQPLDSIPHVPNNPSSNAFVKPANTSSDAAQSFFNPMGGSSSPSPGMSPSPFAPSPAFENKSSGPSNGLPNPNSVFAPVGTFGGSEDGHPPPIFASPKSNDNAFEVTTSDAPPQNLLNASQVHPGAGNSPFPNMGANNTGFGVSGSMAGGPMPGSPFGGPVGTSFSSPSNGLGGNPSGGVPLIAPATPARQNGQHSTGGSPFSPMSRGNGASPFSSGPAPSSTVPKNSPFASDRLAKKSPPKSKPAKTAKKDDRKNADQKKKKKRSRGKRKGGFPLVPVAVCMAGVALSLGVILVFLVLPTKRAREQYDEAKIQSEAGEYLESLAILDQIDPGFMPDEAPDFREEVNRRIRNRTEEWIKDIRNLVDEEKLNKAQTKLKDTIEKSLLEDHERIRAVGALIDAARQCQKAKELAKQEEYKDALEVVRAINRNHLTENYEGTEEEILALLKTMIRRKSKEILSIARQGKGSRAKSMVDELAKKCDDKVQARIDELQRQVNRAVQEFERQNQARTEIDGLQRMMQQRNYLGVLQKIQQMPPQAVQSNPDLQRIQQQIIQLFMKRYQSAIQFIVAKVKGGSEIDINEVFKRVAIAKTQQGVMYVWGQQRGKQMAVTVSPRQQLEPLVKGTIEAIKKAHKEGKLPN